MHSVAQACPKCGLYTPAGTERCDCGHRFGLQTDASRGRSSRFLPVRLVQAVMGSVVLPVLILRETINPAGGGTGFLWLGAAIAIGAANLWLSRLGRWSGAPAILAYLLIAGAVLLGLGPWFACVDHASCP